MPKIMVPLTKAIRSLLPSPPNPEEHLFQTDMRSCLEKVLKTLPFREEFVLKAHFGIGEDKKTLEEIARDLAVTRERIRQIEAHALRRLRLKHFRIIKRELHGYA